MSYNMAATSLGEFKPDGTILKVCIHTSGVRLQIQIPTETATMELHIRMNTTSAALGQLSFGFIWRSQLNRPGEYSNKYR